MDRAGVATAVLSITNPGLWFEDKEAARRLARACNEYGATLVQEHPSRFGLFAAMPLPDVEATLREIEYAYDQLKADGVHLFTSYGDTWLGNAVFTPVMEELNRRKSIVHMPYRRQLLQEPHRRRATRHHGVRHRHYPRHPRRPV